METRTEQRMSSIRLMTLLLVTVSLGACANRSPEPARPTALDSNTWVLMALGEGTLGVRADRRPTLSFRGDGRVSGFDGCNRVNGSYQSDGNTLRFSQMASTRMACPEVEALEQAFNAALSATVRYDIGAGLLLLMDAQDRELARFGPQGG